MLLYYFSELKSILILRIFIVMVFFSRIIAGKATQCKGKSRHFREFGGWHNREGEWAGRVMQVAMETAKDGQSRPLWIFKFQFIVHFTSS